MTLSRSQRIRPVSTDSARAQRRRVERLKRTTHGPERCQWPLGCTSEAVDAHESLNRSQGGDPEDPDWLLCRRHHDDVTSATGELLDWCIRVGLITRKRMRDVYETATLSGMAERKPIAARISAVADRHIQDLAEHHGVSRALVFRAMLSVAAAHPAEVAAKIKALEEA